jgi:hypothetical protein
MHDEAPPLDPNELNLALLASRHEPDPFLVQLAQRSKIAGGFGLGLLVNGMIVIGGLARPSDFAETVDAEWQKAMNLNERPDGTSEEEWASLIERVSTQGAKIIADEIEHEERFHEQGEFYRGPEGFDANTIPAAIARAAIVANAASHLTLRGARIFAPPQPGPTIVPVLRVAIHQVAGWWILATDETGNASFQLWRTDDPAMQRPGS